MLSCVKSNISLFENANFFFFLNPLNLPICWHVQILNRYEKSQVFKKKANNEIVHYHINKAHESSESRIA